MTVQAPALSRPASGPRSELAVGSQGAVPSGMVTRSTKSIGCKGNWTWAEYVCVVLGFLFILKCTHLAHYCFLTKSLVKKKVTRDVGQQMKNLNNQPEGNNVVIVPGIV